MLWVIPVACGVIAVVCIVAGAVPLLRERKAVSEHAGRLQAALPLAVVDPVRLDTALARLNRSIEEIRAELDRLAAAATAIAKAARELRLREAVLAMRVAGAALRALRGVF